MSSQFKRRLLVFLVLVLIAGSALFTHWLLIDRYRVSTDNAYVQGEITRLSSQLSARVEKVLVEDNQSVEQGALLIVLERADFELAQQRAQATLETRQAELNQARSKLEQQSSTISASQADVSAAQASLGRTQVDLSRAQTLRKSGFVSEERVTTLTADGRIANAQLAKAQADLQAQHQQVAALEAEVKRLSALIQSAQAELAQAELNLQRTEIRAPISGFVGQRSAREGQYVQTGSYLLSLVPDQEIWVQANFKETQIGQIRPGQSAELLFDSYPDTPIKGQVDSLFAASGAQFSLLPPDNATGNFTKVVQRIPVKLTFKTDNPLKGLIRPGMSVEATVNIKAEPKHGG